MCLTSWQGKGHSSHSVNRFCSTETQPLSSLQPGSRLTAGAEVLSSTASQAYQRSGASRLALRPETITTSPSLVRYFINCPSVSRPWQLLWVRSALNGLPTSIRSSHQRTMSCGQDGLGEGGVLGQRTRSGSTLGTSGYPSLSLEDLVPQVLDNPEWQRKEEGCLEGTARPKRGCLLTV